MPSYKISELLSMVTPCHKNYRIESIYFKSGDYIKKGDSIMKLLNTSLLKRIDIKAPCNGYISFTVPIVMSSAFLERKVGFHMTLGNFHQYLMERYTNYFNYDCDIQKDLILNDYRLYWKSNFFISDFSGDYYFQIELNFRDGNPILHFRYRMNETIKVNDSLCFFTEKDEAPFLQLKVIKRPHKIDTKLKEVDIVLSNSDIDLLINNKFNFLCVVHANGDRFSFYENSAIVGNNLSTEHLGQTISSFLFKQYVNNFKEAFDLYITEYLLPKMSYASAPDDIIFDICYLYLMHDTRNGYYKIGMSKEPQYRERTLQSEKPSIELVCTKELPRRDIARTFESALHNVFAEKRIRGEWFELSEYDVAILKKTLE